MSPYGSPPPLPSKPFWKSGGGIALIVMLGVGLIIGLCVFGCFGVMALPSVLPSPTP